MSNSIPDGWSAANLGDICTFGGGSAFKEKYQGNRTGDYPFIKVSDMNLAGNERFITYSCNWITGETRKEAKIKLFPKNSVVFAKVGAALLLNRRRMLLRETAIDNNMMAAIPSTADANYLYYLLQSINFGDFVQSGAVPSVNQAQLDAIPIIAPPNSEQRKIASILSAVDEVIEKTEVNIRKLQDLKKGMMQELLIKGIGHSEYKDSPVGRIPKEWDVQSCDDICEQIVVGIVIKPTQYYQPSGVPALRSANVREDGLNKNDLKYISEESNESLRKSKVRLGDVLIVRTGYPGTSAVVTKEYEGCNCVDLIISRPKKSINSHYLCCWVNSDRGKWQVLKSQGGLAQQHFNVGDMKKLLVPVPPKEEQASIATALHSVSETIKQKEQRLEKVLGIKKALMQDLLTGKMRVQVK